MEAAPKLAQTRATFGTSADVNPAAPASDGRVPRSFLNAGTKGAGGVL